MAGVINVTLKHPMVDALVGLEQARSHLYHAATVFDMAIASDQRGEVAVRMAKAQAAQAFAFASDRAIQFHGAFGFTYECDAQLFRRRALWCEQQHGDGPHHRKHLAGLLLD
jgi:alkylation response protein AidB-like acyl-CoA dehydrogenase